MRKPVCCYCVTEIPHSKGMYKDSEGKFWHTRCYKGHQNYLKFKRGDYPLSWYLCDENDDRDDKQGNHHYTPAQDELLREINEYVETYNKYPTWLEMKTLLKIKSDNTTPLKKLAEHGLIQIIFTNPTAYQKYNDAIIKPIQ